MQNRFCVFVETDLAKLLCVRACEQRVEDDDGLIEIPQKNPLKEAGRKQLCVKTRLNRRPGSESFDYRWDERIYHHSYIHPVQVSTVTSRSLSAGGELSDFLAFPLALPTEFLRPSSS